MLAPQQKKPGVAVVSWRRRNQDLVLLSWSPRKLRKLGVDVDCWRIGNQEETPWSRSPRSLQGEEVEGVQLQKGEKVD